MLLTTEDLEGNLGGAPSHFPDKPVLTKLMQQSRLDRTQLWCNFCGSVGGEGEQLVPFELAEMALHPREQQTV